MKRIKKVAFVALSAVVLGSAAYVGKSEASVGDEFDLLHSNVEALTTP